MKLVYIGAYFYCSLELSNRQPHDRLQAPGVGPNYHYPKTNYSPCKGIRDGTLIVPRLIVFLVYSSAGVCLSLSILAYVSAMYTQCMMAYNQARESGLKFGVVVDPKSDTDRG